MHPESLHDLRELVKLHGADAVISAVRAIERHLQADTDHKPVDIADNFKPCRPPEQWHDWTQPPKPKRNYPNG